ncbi:MAG: hypothetical protein PHO74_04985 [Weeksellaceae bacterium]|nr:hypothetical protein [Weeksellaceae bacterium]
MNSRNEDISTKWKQLKSYHPELSPASAAAKLKVSEVELFQSSEGDAIKRLHADYRGLFRPMAQVGKLKLMMRNRSCIYQISGNFTGDESEQIFTIKNEHSVHNLEFRKLKYCFSICEEGKKSFRFYNRFGECVHSIGAVAEIDEVTREITVQFKTENHPIEIEVRHQDMEIPEELNLKEFHNDWKNLDESGEFEGMLKKHNLSRWQAVQNAPNGIFSGKIKKRKFYSLIEEVIGAEIPVKIVGRNDCCVQMYDGNITNISWHEQWFNLFGGHFSLHFETSKFMECRILRKPSPTGIITWVECFDTNYETAFEIYCHREGENPELNEWRKLVNSFED